MLNLNILSCQLKGAVTHCACEEVGVGGKKIIESSSSDVFEQGTSTGSGRSAHLSCDFEQTFGANRLYKSKDT